MRFLLAGLFLAAPLVGIACSSFSSTAIDGGVVDGGVDASAVADSAVLGPTVDDAATDATSFAGDVIRLTDESGAHAVSAAKDSVFWLVGSNIVEGVPALPATTLKTIKLPQTTTATAVGTDGAAMYWAESTSAGSAVLRFAFDQPASSTPYTSNGATSVFAVGPAGFLAGPGGAAGASFYAPNGGAAVANVFHELDNAVVDATAIESVFHASFLYQTPLGGGEVELAHNLPSPSSLVTDTNNVYAVVQSGTAIVKVPRGSRVVDDSVTPLRRLITNLPQGTTLLAGDSRGGLFVWTDGDHSVSRIDPDTGTRTELLGNVTRVESFAANDRGLFWATPTAVLWLPL